jgi:primosomal replication protein N
MLSGRVSAREALRHTPAGIPVLSLEIAHASEQPEAGIPRRVSLQIEVIAIGPTAQALDQVTPGQQLKLSGFLSNRSKRSQRIVLHVNDFELI